MNSTLMFYMFFCILLIGSVIVIIMRWKRYMKYSNGTYINAGQNLIFKTEMSQSEIIQQLKTHNANDTLEYDFFEKNNEYFLEVKGIKRIFFKPRAFSIEIAAAALPPVASIGSTTNTSLFAQSAGSLQ